MIHSFNINIATKYGVHSAIILDNLNYWITKNQANEQHFYDGHYWTYNSKKAFAELFPYMTERQIDYALKKLIDDGIIITGKYNTNKYNQTLWYAITNFGYSILQNCEMEQTNLSNQYDKIVECNTNNKQADIKQQIITTNNKENPYTEKPFTENPNTEKPNTENPQQLNTKPLNTESDINITNKKLNINVQIEQEFEEVWKIYPRKEDKKKAFMAYKTARKKASFDEIKKGVETYSNHIRVSNTDKRYIKLGATYFNGECWANNYEQVAPTEETEEQKTQRELLELRKARPDLSNYSDKDLLRYF